MGQITANVIHADRIIAHRISAGVFAAGATVFDRNTETLHVQAPDGRIPVHSIPTYRCNYCSRDLTFNKGEHSCDGCGAPLHRQASVPKAAGGRLGSNPRPRRPAAK